MSGIFRRIGTLHGCQPRLVSTCTAHTVAVFQHIYPFSKMVEEEIGGSILDIHILADTVVPAIAGDAADRFEASAALVFQLYKVHWTVCADAQP